MKLFSILFFFLLTQANADTNEDWFKTAQALFDRSSTISTSALPLTNVQGSLTMTFPLRGFCRHQSSDFIYHDQVQKNLGITKTWDPVLPVEYKFWTGHSGVITIFGDKAAAGIWQPFPTQSLEIEIRSFTKDDRRYFILREKEENDNNDEQVLHLCYLWSTVPF